MRAARQFFSPSYFYEDCEINQVLIKVENKKLKWHLINYSSDFWYDSRLRCDVVDLYFKLYGRKRPHAVPIAELAMLNKATKIKSENSEAKVSLSMCELFDNMTLVVVFRVYFVIDSDRERKLWYF